MYCVRNAPLPARTECYQYIQSCEPLPCMESALHVGDSSAKLMWWCVERWWFHKIHQTNTEPRRSSYLVFRSCVGFVDKLNLVHVISFQFVWPFFCCHCLWRCVCARLTFCFFLACDIVVCMIRFYTISAKLAKICFSQSHFVWHRFQYPVCVCCIENSNVHRCHCFVVLCQLRFFFLTSTRMGMSKQKKKCVSWRWRKPNRYWRRVALYRQRETGVPATGLTKLTLEIATRPNHAVKKATSRMCVCECVRGGSLHDAHLNGENIRAILYWLNFNSQSKHNIRPVDLDEATKIPAPSFAQREEKKMHALELNRKVKWSWWIEHASIQQQSLMERTILNAHVNKRPVFIRASKRLLFLFSCFALLSVAMFNLSRSNWNGMEWNIVCRHRCSPFAQFCIILMESHDHIKQHSWQHWRKYKHNEIRIMCHLQLILNLFMNRWQPMKKSCLPNQSPPPNRLHTDVHMPKSSLYQYIFCFYVCSRWQTKHRRRRVEKNSHQRKRIFFCLQQKRRIIEFKKKKMCVCMCVCVREGPCRNATLSVATCIEFKLGINKVIYWILNTCLKWTRYTHFFYLIVTIHSLLLSLLFTCLMDGRWFFGICSTVTTT